MTNKDIFTIGNSSTQIEGLSDFLDLDLKVHGSKTHYLCTNSTEFKDNLYDKIDEL